MRQSDSVSEELDTENVQCALDFENTMNELETQLYYRHLPPKEVALRVMEAACKFYDADWCGLIQVDLDLGLWKPLWWHNECQEDKTTIQYSGDGTKPDLHRRSPLWGCTVRIDAGFADCPAGTV